MRGRVAFICVFEANLALGLSQPNATLGLWIIPKDRAVVNSSAKPVELGLRFSPDSNGGFTDTERAAKTPGGRVESDRF
jgi:hypothetical protein